MRKKKKNLQDTMFSEIAGVSFVISELSRRGIVAVHTPARTKGADIIAMKRDGNKLAFRALELKTTLNPKPQGFWPLSKPGNTPVDKNLFYVFVRMGASDSKRRALEAYIVPSQRVNRERTKPAGRWNGSWPLPKSEKMRQELLDWDTLWSTI